MEIKASLKQNKIGATIKEGVVIYRESGREPQFKNVSFNENGDYKVLPDDGFVLEEVGINVNVPIPEGYIVPEGKVEIKDAKEIDVTQYSKAQIVNENLKAENIAENVEVLGIKGTFRGGIDTSDATITPDKVLKDYIGYAKEEKIVGTIETYDYSNSEGVPPNTEFIDFLAGNVKYIDNDYVTTLKNYAFYMDKTLEFVRLNNVGALQTSIFGGCSALVELHLPNCRQIYGGSCVSNCTLLKVIDMPQLQSASASSIFYGCSVLEEVNFPALTTIGGSFFGNCYLLEKVDFGALKIINATSFSNCYSLKKVILRGDTVCELRNTNAFQGCYHLLGTVNETYNPEGLKDGCFFVKDELVDDYKSATNWVTYASQIRPLSELEG